MQTYVNKAVGRKPIMRIIRVNELLLSKTLQVEVGKIKTELKKLKDKIEEKEKS